MKPEAPVTTAGTVVGTSRGPETKRASARMPVPSEALGDQGQLPGTVAVTVWIERPSVTEIEAVVG